MSIASKDLEVVNPEVYFFGQGAVIFKNKIHKVLGKRGDVVVLRNDSDDVSLQRPNYEETIEIPFSTFQESYQKNLTQQLDLLPEIPEPCTEACPLDEMVTEFVAEDTIAKPRLKGPNYDVELEKAREIRYEKLKSLVNTIDYVYYPDHWRKLSIRKGRIKHIESGQPYKATVLDYPDFYERKLNILDVFPNTDAAFDNQH